MTNPLPSEYLAIDAGNTRIKFGRFTFAAGDVLPVCVASGHVMCGQPLPAAALGSPVTGRLQAVLSGSNPPEIERLAREWPDDLAHLAVVTDRTTFPIAVDVESPSRVGLDRLLNAIAALRLRQPGQPVVIVDSGTAVTVDYVNRSGAFAGGAILPGIGMGARALHRYTAMLPLLAAPGIAAAPPEVLGRNTVAAMSSGLYWGHVGAVRELANRIAESDPGDPPRLMLVTGGAGAVVSPHLERSQEWPFLPLQGLVLAYLAGNGG
ncbi:Type III pantothenate kinase [Caulifigura coniformis]|uniref:Type III pantothenate kinase n=1 Tax=Caulifigura coniformis TaxID=2527983 RepID=A0A517SDX6_9PLAN|nr:type III pantothenate kinase [Caulifigura coniformis]QDT54329.1 Type III pantothenate kinase [Caulifigura coniformis]